MLCSKSGRPAETAGVSMAACHGAAFHKRAPLANSDFRSCQPRTVQLRSGALRASANLGVVYAPFGVEGPRGAGEAAEVHWPTFQTGEAWLAQGTQTFIPGPALWAWRSVQVGTHTAPGLGVRAQPVNFLVSGGGALPHVEFPQSEQNTARRNEDTGLVGGTSLPCPPLRT